MGLGSAGRAWLDGWNYIDHWVGIVVRRDGPGICRKIAVVKMDMDTVMYVSRRKRTTRVCTSKGLQSKDITGGSVL